MKWGVGPLTRPEKASSSIGLKWLRIFNSFISVYFKEYEDCATQEAKFVKDLDKFEMVLQAFEYETLQNRPKQLQDFFDSTKGRIENKNEFDTKVIVHNIKKR